MAYIQTFCEKCNKTTTHKVYTKDFWGFKDGWRNFGVIASFGASLVGSDTYSVCCSCGKKTYID